MFGRPKYRSQAFYIIKPNIEIHSKYMVLFKVFNRLVNKEVGIIGLGIRNFDHKPLDIWHYKSRHFIKELTTAWI